MIFTIVACGQTAKDWIPRGHSIGVNDSWRFGKPTDSLLVCNRPSNFTEERLKVITTSKPETFYSHKANWAYAFPAWKKINLCQWYGRLVKGMHYSSNTSPFIALTLAYNLGAKDIIMWGCDFVSHPTFNPDNPYRDKEIDTYMELIAELKEQGVNVWLGKEGTAFDKLIPVYKFIEVKDGPPYGFIKHDL
jgi:hypothetical protein